MAGRFVDFYALLDVASDASFDAVRSAVVQQRRDCESYQATGGPADQQTTEDRIRDLDLAELVLLDPEQRADYDEEWRERRNGHSSPGPVAAPSAPEAVAAPDAWPLPEQDASGSGATPAPGPAAAPYESAPGAAHAAAAPGSAAAPHGAAPGAAQEHAWPLPGQDAPGSGATPAPGPGAAHEHAWSWPEQDASASGATPAPASPEHAWPAPPPAGASPQPALPGLPGEAEPAPNGASGQHGTGEQAASTPPVAVRPELALSPPTVSQPSSQPATRQQPAVPDTVEPEDDWVGQARGAMQAGDAAQAIDSYHYAIMLHPHEIGLHYELGHAYVLAGNYEQALGAFETATRLAPQVADYRAAVGNALVHLGRPGEALSVLEQVVAEVPTERRYRAELAQALHDTCVHEMTPLANGLVCITTAEQAGLVERLTGRALSLLDPADNSQLAEDIREKYRLAQLATQRVWRPPLPWVLMIAVAVVPALGFGLFLVWWSALIVLAVLAGVAFLLGLQPTYWHVAREARSTKLLA